MSTRQTPLLPKQAGRIRIRESHVAATTLQTLVIRFAQTFETRIREHGIKGVLYGLHQYFPRIFHFPFQRLVPSLYAGVLTVYLQPVS